MGLSCPPGVCFGAVMHRRRHPVAHRFVYPVACLRLPLRRLNKLRVPLLGIDRPQVFSFRSADHGPRDGSPLLPWLEGLLRARGLAQVCTGEVVLQTFPRIFGYVFNPVSFWFCHDSEGALRAVLAEVNNTFGETHSYLLCRDDRSPIASGETFLARKAFHVSPFFPLRGEYRFRFHFGASGQSVSIDYLDGATTLLETRIGGRLAPLDAAAMWRWLVRHPLMTAMVTLRIHWQALRLLARRLPLFKKPRVPIEEISG